MIDLTCAHLGKQFKNHWAVKDLNFEVSQGSFFSILGPSGCGKTTLLRMIAGFETPDAGDILIKGESMLQVPPNRRPVNLVFQHLALFPTMTVGENIQYGLKRRGVKAPERQRRMQDILERVGLEGYTSRQISQLSGGQKQRVALARCLVLEPALLLLDEPLGALDLKLRDQMKVELKHMQAQFGTTFVYITHDQSEALVMSDQVAVMNGGKFEQVASPQTLYSHPKTPFVANFVGENNRLPGIVTSIDNDFITLSLAEGIDIAGRAMETGMAIGDEATLFIRPEAIELYASETSKVLSASVINYLFDGSNSRLEVNLHGHPAFVSLTQGQQYSPGSQIQLGFNPDAGRIYRGNLSSE